MASREDLMKLTNKALADLIKKRQALGELLTHSSKTKKELVDTLLGVYVKKAKKTPTKAAPTLAADEFTRPNLMKLTNAQLVQLVKDKKAAGEPTVTYSGKDKKELVDTLLDVYVKVKKGKKAKPVAKAELMEEEEEEAAEEEEEAAEEEEAEVAGGEVSEDDVRAMTNDEIKALIKRSKPDLKPSTYARLKKDDLIDTLFAQA